MRQKKPSQRVHSKETRQDKAECKTRNNAPRWLKCIRPEYPAHGGVMLCTVQCRPASACARKSPPRVHSKETRQDKAASVAQNVQGVLPAVVLFYFHSIGIQVLPSSSPHPSKIPRIKIQCNLIPSLLATTAVALAAARRNFLRVPTEIDLTSILLACL